MPTIIDFKAAFLAHFKGLQFTAVVSTLTVLLYALLVYSVIQNAPVSENQMAVGLGAMSAMLLIFVAVTPIFNSPSRYLSQSNGEGVWSKFKWLDLFSMTSIHTYMAGFKAASLTVIPMLIAEAISTSNSMPWYVKIGFTFVLLGLLPFHWHMGYLIQNGSGIRAAFKNTIGQYKELFKSATVWLCGLLSYGMVWYYGIMGLYDVWQPESQSYGAAFILLLGIVATVSVLTLYHTVVVFFNTAAWVRIPEVAVRSESQEESACTIDKNI